MNKLSLKTYFKKKKQRISVFGISPDFDWKFIMFFSCLLLCVGIFFSGYLYFNLINDSLLKVDIQPNEGISSSQKLNKIKQVTESLNAQPIPEVFDESTTN